MKTTPFLLEKVCRWHYEAVVPKMAGKGDHQRLKSACTMYTIFIRALQWRYYCTSIAHLHHIIISSSIAFPNNVSLMSI